MVKVRANTTLFIILQYINISNQGVVHLKLTVLHVNDISILFYFIYLFIFVCVIKFY